MVRQETIFLASEGNAWFSRNSEPSEDYADPVIYAMADAGIKPDTVLEIGCGTGWRLDRLNKLCQCKAYGIDPSGEAIHYGTNKYPNLRLIQSTATDIDIEHIGVEFNVIIFGFCLYLCDRDDIFAIVNLSDYRLLDGGYIIIHDFLPEYPHCKPYHHVGGVYSYKMDYSKLWLVNPAYSLVLQKPTRDGEGVTIIKKNEKDAWPIETN